MPEPNAPLGALEQRLADLNAVLFGLDATGAQRIAAADEIEEIRGMIAAHEADEYVKATTGREDELAAELPSCRRDIRRATQRWHAGNLRRHLAAVDVPASREAVTVARVSHARYGVERRPRSSQRRRRPSGTRGSPSPSGSSDDPEPSGSLDLELPAVALVLAAEVAALVWVTVS